MDSPFWTSSTREARIQKALDYRRSPSSFVGYTSFPVGFPVSRPRRMGTLSEEEEDELEGRAGDAGSVEFRKSRTLWERNFPSQEFATKNIPTSFPVIVEPQQIDPVVKVVPASRSLPTEESSEHLHSSLELISILAYLTTFGIIGVVIRYLLEVLFGPDEAKLTSDKSALFIDLPANMLGSFFMGWVGVVFKKDIALFSEHLAIGLSTGLMGSITTYAAMIQRNLEIMVTDSWVTGLFGMLIGGYICELDYFLQDYGIREGCCCKSPENSFQMVRKHCNVLL